MYFERLQKELDLTAAQSEQVKSILNDFWQYYRTVLSEGRTRIEQVLTAEQRLKFERLLQEQKR
jgi:Spy/CpxP family protein refolding chaperone